MFLPNTNRQINLSSSEYRTPASIIDSLGFNPNSFNPLTPTEAGGNPVNLSNVNNMMENYNSFWSHTVPADMPWAQPQIQPSPANVNPLASQPFIMRFTAGPSIFNQVCSPDPCTSQTATEWELLNKLSSGTGTCTSNLHLKRRSSSDDDDETVGQPPTKQYISEDKVTAKFNQMSLNNMEPLIVDSMPDKVDLDEVVEEVDEDLPSQQEKISIENPKIVLSDEIKKALAVHNDRIERIFQDELNKSTKSLVLWQPPIGLLPPPLTVYKTEEKEEDKSEEIEPPKQADLIPLDLDIDVTDAYIMDSNEMMDL